MDPFTTGALAGAGKVVGEKATKFVLSKKWFRKYGICRKTKLLGNLCGQYHIITHAIRDFLYIKEEESLEKHFYGMCLRVVDSTSEVFSYATGAKMSTCIKLYKKESDEDCVMTFCRDRNSFHLRGGKKRDNPTPIDGNTDFLHLHKINLQFPYFLGENLYEAYAKGIYCNTHPDFGKYYQSTIV